MLEHEHWDRLIALVGEVLESLLARKHRHSIETSDSEDALAAWLREGGVTDAWKVATVLVGAGLDKSGLLSLREDLPKNAFDDAVRWIALRITIRTLLDDAEQCTGRIAGLVDAVRSSARQERAEAADIDVPEQIGSTERISELVRAVKSYSFMGQAPWQEIDVHEGIENTLIILGHKLRNVTVTRDF